MNNISIKIILLIAAGFFAAAFFSGCKPPKVDAAMAGDAAKKSVCSPW